jgi:hypothetical protein
VSNYDVTATDVALRSSYSSTGTSAINLPALSGTTNGRVIVVIDSVNNATTNPITVVASGSDAIGGAIGEGYVINVSGSAIWLYANTETDNWEII